MWIYAQATGKLLDPNGDLAGTGYAGKGKSKNKPDDQCKADQGPLPRNNYTIGRAIDHPRLGPLAMQLVPDDLAQMCGRSAFYIHGDSSSHPGEASDGCIIMSRNIRQLINDSGDRRLKVVEDVDAALATGAEVLAKSKQARIARRASVPLTLMQFVLPLILMLAAAGVTWLFAPNSPSASLFLAWGLSAAAAACVVRSVDNPLVNEVGRQDAAHLFTIAWFVLLASGMAAGSLWNVFEWKPGAHLDAFVHVPPSVWILGGITLLSNAGVRATFALSEKAYKRLVEPATSATEGLMLLPLDSDGSNKMMAGQYVMFNLLALVVYAVAIARLFASTTAQGVVGPFPDIPVEVLGLFAVSGGGLVVASAIPTVRSP